MKEFNDKVAFVTGAGSGIGLGMARAFLDAGMKVVLADVRQASLTRAAQTLGELGEAAGRYHLMQVDVADRAAMARAAEETVQVFGKVHVLCNNAGVSGDTPIDQASYEEWDWILGVNLGGIVNGVRSFLPKIQAHGEGGHIVNTGSIASLLPMPGGAGIYSTSKFAARGLTESLRLALAFTNIGVSGLYPGLVNSEIVLSAGELSPLRSQKAADPMGAEIGAAMMAAGMDPMLIGQRVLQGIRANEACILTHGEFKEEVRALCDDLLAAFPPPPQGAEQGRLMFEEGRRQLVAAAQAAIKANT
jgi:NAD(P)-dependent dehydrogenase (short-subunit alcohol dehydrogenase family)